MHDRDRGGRETGSSHPADAAQDRLEQGREGLLVRGHVQDDGQRDRLDEVERDAPPGQAHAAQEAGAVRAKVASTRPRASASGSAATGRLGRDEFSVRSMGGGLSGRGAPGRRMEAGGPRHEGRDRAGGGGAAGSRQGRPREPARGSLKASGSPTTVIPRCSAASRTLAMTTALRRRSETRTHASSPRRTGLHDRASPRARGPRRREGRRRWRSRAPSGRTSRAASAGRA